MAFNTPIQKWISARGRAKWRVKGLQGNIKGVINSPSLIISDEEKGCLKNAFAELSWIMRGWDDTTKVEKEKAWPL